MDCITGKNILLVCDNFYDYDIAIRNELIRLGAHSVYLKNVDFSITSPLNYQNLNGWVSITLRYLLNPWGRTKWTKQFVEEIKDKRFDILLVIENTTFKKWFLSYIKKKNPGIKTIWFLWDKFSTQQLHFQGYIPLFDRVYTFDRDDSKQYNIEYFPDFFIQTDNENSHIYDICFVGTANSSCTFHRIELMAKINRICKTRNLKSFFHLKYYNEEPKSILQKLRRKFFKNRYERKISNYLHEGFLFDTDLPLNKVNYIMQNSDIILDLNHKNRQGMTLNVIMALANGKKLITTNSRIIEEDFYDSETICIIDENNPSIPDSFFTSKSTKKDLSYLRLDYWLKHIINL